MTLPLPSRFIGSTATRRCAFPGCEAIGTEDHHITYDPEVTVRLCGKHHREITDINSVEARRYKRILTNKHRWHLWYQWIQCKRKSPRRTHLTDAWNAGRVCLVCGSRSLRRSRTWRELVCKSCGSHGDNIGTLSELESEQSAKSPK